MSWRRKADSRESTGTYFGDDMKAALAARMIREQIESLPAADKKKVNDCVDELRAVLAKHGDAASIALGLIGAEEAAGNTQRFGAANLSS
jgi:hypothetical protein